MAGQYAAIDHYHRADSMFIEARSIVSDETQTPRCGVHEPAYVMSKPRPDMVVYFGD